MHLGKPVEKATKARPLKVIFADEQAKKLVAVESNRPEKNSV